MRLGKASIPILALLTFVVLLAYQNFSFIPIRERALDDALSRRTARPLIAPRNANTSRAAHMQTPTERWNQIMNKIKIEKSDPFGFEFDPEKQNAELSYTGDLQAGLHYSSGQNLCLKVKAEVLEKGQLEINVTPDTSSGNVELNWNW